MRAAAILWCLAIPGLQVYLFRRTFPDLWKNHIEGPKGFLAMIAGFVAARVASFNQGRNEISFRNGSKIYLCHCQHEKDVYNYQGAEIHVLMIDELTHFTETIYRYLRGRVRMIGVAVPAAYAGLFPRILCGSNPGNAGHNWVRQTFVDGAAPRELRRMPAKDGGFVRQYLPARMEDNPDLMRDDPDYVERLEGLGDEVLVRALKLGDWNIVAGGMFDDVWDSARHVLPGGWLPPPGWTIDRAFDWGSTRPFSVGWWAEADGTEATLPGGRPWAPPRGSLVRIAEWYGWNGTANEGCKMLSENIARGILDRERDLGIAGRVSPGPADSSIYDVADGQSIASKMSLNGVTWRAANKGPGSRKNGWELMRSMLAAARKSPPEDPGLWVTAGCEQFIRTIPTLPRDGKDRDDVDTAAEDHIADETRYRVLERKRVFSETKLTGT